MLRVTKKSKKSRLTGVALLAALSVWMTSCGQPSSGASAPGKYTAPSSAATNSISTIPANIVNALIGTYTGQVRLSNAYTTGQSSTQSFTYTLSRSSDGSILVGTLATGSASDFSKLETFYFTSSNSSTISSDVLVDSKLSSNAFGILLNVQLVNGSNGTVQVDPSQSTVSIVDCGSSVSPSSYNCQISSPMDFSVVAGTLGKR